MHVGLKPLWTQRQPLLREPSGSEGSAWEIVLMLPARSAGQLRSKTEPGDSTRIGRHLVHHEVEPVAGVIARRERLKTVRLPAIALG